MNLMLFGIQSVASRIFEEMGIKLGEEVGHTLRFEDITDVVSIYAFHHLVFLSSYLVLMVPSFFYNSCINGAILFL